MPGYSREARRNAALARRIRGQLGESAYEQFKRTHVIPAGLKDGPSAPVRTPRIPVDRVGTRRVTKNDRARGKISRSDQTRLVPLLRRDSYHLSSGDRSAVLEAVQNGDLSGLSTFHLARINNRILDETGGAGNTPRNSALERTRARVNAIFEQKEEERRANVGKQLVIKPESVAAPKQHSQGARASASLVDKIRHYDNPEKGGDGDIDRMLRRTYALQKKDDRDLIGAAEILYPDDPQSGLEQMSGLMDSRNTGLMNRLQRLADGYVLTT